MSCCGTGAGAGGTFVVRQGDTLPPLIADVEVDCGSELDLTGWSVTFTMDGPTTIGPTAATVQPGGELGVLRYDWAVGDTDTPGTYSGRFVGTSPAGKRQTFPTSGSIEIIVEAT